MRHDGAAAQLAHPRRTMVNRWLQPPPSAQTLPTLSTRRGYLSALGLLGLLLGADTIQRLGIGAGLVQPAWATWARWPASGTYGAVVTGSAVWLLALWARRARPRPALPLAAACTAGLLGVALVASSVLRPARVADPVRVLAVAGVGIWMCLSVAHDRGISAGQMGLKPGWGADRARLVQAMALCGITVCAICATQVIIAVFWALPVPKITGGQADLFGMSGMSFHALTTAAAFRKEIVFVAAIVIFLTAAGRPAWEIYTVSDAARILYHAYLGVPALGVGLFAATSVWLFARTRRLSPLIATHLSYNTALSIGGTAVTTAIQAIGLLTIAVVALGAVLVRR